MTTELFPKFSQTISFIIRQHKSVCEARYSQEIPGHLSIWRTGYYLSCIAMTDFTNYAPSIILINLVVQLNSASVKSHVQKYLLDVV